MLLYRQQRAAEAKRYIEKNVADNERGPRAHRNKSDVHRGPRDSLYGRSFSIVAVVWPFKKKLKFLTLNDLLCMVARPRNDGLYCCCLLPHIYIYIGYTRLSPVEKYDFKDV